VLLALTHAEEEKNRGHKRPAAGGWRARHAKERKALVAAVDSEVPVAIEAAAPAAAADPAVALELAELARAAQRWLPRQRAAAAAAARKRALHRQKRSGHGDDDDDEDGGGEDGRRNETTADALPPDVVALILRRVASPLELARGAAVCRAWRLAADREDQALWRPWMTRRRRRRRQQEQPSSPSSSWRRRFGDLALANPRLVLPYAARRALVPPQFGDDDDGGGGPVKGGARLVWLRPGDLVKAGEVATTPNAPSNAPLPPPPLPLPLPLTAEDAAVWLAAPARECWSRLARRLEDDARRRRRRRQSGGDSSGDSSDSSSSSDSEEDDEVRRRINARMRLWQLPRPLKGR
jgi:hypothetical protein